MNNVKLFYMERLPLTTILMSRTCLNYVCVFFFRRYINVAGNVCGFL